MSMMVRGYGMLNNADSERIWNANDAYSKSIWNAKGVTYICHEKLWSTPISMTVYLAAWNTGCSHVFSCNSNLKAPGPMKVVVVGSDLYISCVLRPYVDQFSSKPPDFQNHIRFLIIPLGELGALNVSHLCFFCWIIKILCHIPLSAFFTSRKGNFWWKLLIIYWFL